MSGLETDSLADLLVTSICDLRIGASANERAEAARRLGRTHSQVAVSYLVEALSDDVPEVQSAVAEALGAIGDQTALDPLRAVLERKASPRVVKSSVRKAIDRIKTDGSKEPQSPLSPFETDAALFRETNNADLSSAPSTETPPSTSGDKDGRFRGEEERQRLEEVYRRGAEERQLIEEARRRANEQASRRFEEERLRLHVEEESLASFKAELKSRREAIEAAKSAEEEEARRIKKIEEEVRAEEMNRRLLEQEKLRLEAELRLQTEQQRHHLEALQRQAAEQQKLAEEHQRSRENAEHLCAEAEANHHRETERLGREQAAFQQAEQELIKLRLELEAARKTAEEEILKLREARERIEIEEEAFREAEHERLALEAEVRVRAEEERRRLEEMRRQDAEHQEQVEEEARLRAEEDKRRRAELEALRESLLRIDGRFSGPIASPTGTLIVGAGGHVDANIEVAVATIQGTVKGDVIANQRIELGRAAKLHGNIQTPSLVIEQGAMFEGSCKMTQKGAVEKTAKAERKENVIDTAKPEISKIEPSNKKADDGLVREREVANIAVAR